MVAVVPELSGDEDLGARDSGFLDGRTDGGLGAVDPSCVNVSVACFQGFGDGVFSIVFLQVSIMLSNGARESRDNVSGLPIGMNTSNGLGKYGLGGSILPGSETHSGYSLLVWGHWGGKSGGVVRISAPVFNFCLVWRVAIELALQ